MSMMFLIQPIWKESNINNETVMSKIEYAKKVLTEYGKENVTIPYFIEGT